MDEKIKKINKFLFIVFPLAFVTGPLIPELIILIIIFLFFFQLKKEIFQKINFDIFEIKWFIFFLITIFFQSFFSIDYFLSFKNTTFYFRYLLAFLIFTLVLLRNDKAMSQLNKILVLFVLFVCFDLFLQFITGANFFGMVSKYPLGNRFSGLFGDEYIMGSYLFKILPIINFLFLYNFKNTDKKMFIISVITSLIIYVSIFIAGERTSLAHLIIYIFLLSLLSKQIFKINLISLGIATVIIFFIVQNNENIFKRNIYFFKNQVQNFFLNIKNIEKNTPINLSIYNSLYNSAIITFKEKPILGSGPNTFRKSCLENKKIHPKKIIRCSTHPHNFYIQLLSESGILGFIMLVFFYLYLIKILLLHVFKKQIIYDHVKPLIIGMLVFFFPLSPSGNFFNNWLTYLIFYPLTFIIYLKSIKMFYNDKLLFQRKRSS